MKYPHLEMLPEEAFQHIGNKKIKLHGLFSSIADTVGDAFSEAADFIGDIVSGVDSFVRDNIPGGWLLPIAAVASYAAAPLFAAEGAAAAGAEALGAEALGSELAGLTASTVLDVPAITAAIDAGILPSTALIDAGLAGAATGALESISPSATSGLSGLDFDVPLPEGITAPSGGLSQSLVDMGVPFNVVQNIPSIQQLASKAAINAATQLITTGKIDTQSIAKSLVTGSLGSVVGGTVSSGFDDKLIGSIVGGAAQGATTALANGQNPFSSAIYSSLASGLGYGLKDAGVPIPQSSVNAMVGSLAQGKSVTEALIAAGTGALGSYVAPYVKGAINDLTTQQTDQLGATSQEFTTPESIAKAVSEGTLTKQQGEDAIIALKNQNALSNTYQGALSAQSSLQDIQSKYSDAVNQYNAQKQEFLSNADKYNNDPIRQKYDSLISAENSDANTAQSAIDKYNSLLKDYQTITAGMDPRSIKSYADDPGSALENLGKTVPLYALQDAQKAANEAIATYDTSKKSLQDFIFANKSSIDSLQSLKSTLDTQASNLSSIYSNITAQTDQNGNLVPNLYSNYQNAVNSYNQSISDYTTAQRGFYSSLTPAPVSIQADTVQAGQPTVSSGQEIQGGLPTPIQQTTDQSGGLPYQTDFTGSYVSDTGQIPPVIGDYPSTSTDTPITAEITPTNLPISDQTTGTQSTTGALPTAQQVMPEIVVEDQQPATTPLPPIPAGEWVSGYDLPSGDSSTPAPTPAPVTAPVTTTVPVSGLPTASTSTGGVSGGSGGASGTSAAAEFAKYVNPIPSYLRPTELSTGAVSQAPALWAGIDPRLAEILTQRAAHGGQIHPRLMKVLHERGGELVPGPENRLYMRHAKRGFAVEGPGTGQSDDIPTMLSQDEYVIDADTVAALGDGSSKAGAEALDKMREEIRRHKRSAPVDKIPPKAKSPLEYLKMAKRK